MIFINTPKERHREKDVRESKIEVRVMETQREWLSGELEMDRAGRTLCRDGCMEKPWSRRGRHSHTGAEHQVYWAEVAPGFTQEPVRD